MVHYMKLQDAPFYMIASGEKTIELRLYDEKRSTICVGDRIVFSRSRDMSETIETEVTALHRFESFEKLYEVLPLDRCGYRAQELADASPKDMEQYYSAQEQETYGVIGIELRLI